MVYKIPLRTLPKIEEAYEIERKTVWRCADKRSILLFITEGSCLLEIGNEKRVLNAGDVFLIPSEKKYTRKPYKDQSCRLFYVHFTTESVPSSFSLDEAKKELRTAMAKTTALSAEQRLSCTPEFLFIKQYTNVAGEFERLSNLLHQILTHQCIESNLSPLFASLYLVEFMANIALSAESNAADEIVDQDLPLPLRLALSCIQQNNDKKICANDICAYCHVSPQHLIRLFKKYFGMTPLQYITQNKISTAIELLRTSELSIKEISYALGYDNPNYFSRLFTKEEGYSPSELRDRIRSYQEGTGALIEK